MGPWPSLGLISDAARVGEERFLEALRDALAAGLRLVQVREPAWSRERALALARRAAGLAGAVAPGALVLVSRWWEALPVEGLAGAHLGGGDPAVVGEARAALGAGAILGYSAHGLEEAREAERQGATYVSLSPIYGALSKRHPLPPLGLERLAEASRALAIPVMALGGVEPRHAAELRAAGAGGACMIGGILDAPAPASAVRAFLSGWARAG